MVLSACAALLSVEPLMVLVLGVALVLVVVLGKSFNQKVYTPTVCTSHHWEQSHCNLYYANAASWA